MECLTKKKIIGKKQLFCVLLHQYFEGIRYVPVKAALFPLLGCDSLHEAVHQPMIGMKLNWKMHFRSRGEVLQLNRVCRYKCSACFSKINNIVLVLLITSDLFPESHIFQLTKVILLHCWINGVIDSEGDLLVFPITMP